MLKKFRDYFYQNNIPLIKKVYFKVAITEMYSQIPWQLAHFGNPWSKWPIPYSSVIISPSKLYVHPFFIILIHISYK